MSKVRTNLYLTRENHAWLQEQAARYGDMSEALNHAVQEQRVLRPVAERLGVLVATLEARLRMKGGEESV